MQVKSKRYCLWELVNLISEESLKKKDGTFYTLSITDGDELELMIFLSKSHSDFNYEVKVYKFKPYNKYVPLKNDNVKHYEENDKYATFFFETFNQAHHFLEAVINKHPEYRSRPARRISRK